MFKEKKNRFQVKEVKKQIVKIITVILFIMCIGSIYEQWTDMFYEFGRSLYYLFH